MIRFRLELTASLLALAAVLPPTPASAAPEGTPGGNQCQRSTGVPTMDGATQLMDGLLQIGSFPPYQLPDPIDWSADPYDNLNWVGKFQNLQWTDPLRRAYLETNDVQYLNRWRQFVESWIDANPRDKPAHRLAWGDRITGMRTLLLACAADWFAPTSHYRNALFTHAETLADENFYRGHGNHALGQAMGLLAASCKLAQPAWIELARSRLDTLLPLAIDPEGGSNEGSMSYAMMSHSEWGGVIARLEACSQPANGDIAAARSRLARFIVHATLPDGTWPVIGDSRTTGPPLGLSANGDYLLTRGAQGRPARAHHRWYKKAGWVFDRSSWIDPDATHMVLRTSRVSMHNHWDQGSIVLAGYGRRLLDEGGAYGFVQAWKKYLKGTAAHNLLLVDDVALVRPVQRAAVERFRGPDWFAYRLRLPIWQGVRWVRTIVSVGGGGIVIVADKAFSETNQTWRQTWHLGGNKMPRLTPTGMQSTYRRGNLSMEFSGQSVALRVVSGQLEPRVQGWRSWHLREVVPAPTIEAVRSGRRFGQVTVLAVGKSAPRIVIDRGAATKDGFLLDAVVNGKKLTARFTQTLARVSHL